MDGTPRRQRMRACPLRGGAAAPSGRRWGRSRPSTTHGPHPPCRASRGTSRPLFEPARSASRRSGLAPVTPPPVSPRRPAPAARPGAPALRSAWRIEGFRARSRRPSPPEPVALGLAVPPNAPALAAVLVLTRRPLRVRHGRPAMRPRMRPEPSTNRFDRPKTRRCILSVSLFCILTGFFGVTRSFPQDAENPRKHWLLCVFTGVLKWGGMRGTIPQHPDPQSGALPIELLSPLSERAEVYLIPRPLAMPNVRGRGRRRPVALFLRRARPRRPLFMV